MENQTNEKEVLFRELVDNIAKLDPLQREYLFGIAEGMALSMKQNNLSCGILTGEGSTFKKEVLVQ